ncbi:tRNA 5-methoxyuridine(34)/uridine 5-oxyacetic acid(34) synthase CmoB [Pectobacterium brasiliense]|uniref:tRNA 5-methoxyuridine(34)/uridine 5-oxyacetic acid(34) synthase CmoB n=1 Tax=Pectobacterium brasiliense TaxID=180957 RepID=UPI002A80AF12|nr:tRNA 5-methoxyuridine(34)/uridine 5-oxyacetic acid(34) synthase CmoB [Pectobacterium brasiliense]MDY4336262.1 tRNA 5-methoxyuridine(34)/uridine 5-oxyacetic acid(34) synthase CmoB [Pectobacterium brasiliense]
MIDFGNFYQQIAKGPLSHWLNTLPSQLSSWQQESLHGKFKLWFNSLEHLPSLTPTALDLNDSVTARMEPDISEGQREGIEKLLRNLMPWRKGPFSLYGVDINTEWRSDWKWQRVLPHISPLKNRLILDVGCGSGYHLWRMVGEGATMAVGIDPMQLFLCQFEAVRKLLGDDQRAHVLPLGIEQLPELAAFDTVFSMGVLYHRRSPLDHLWQLKNQLVAGGELVLETLVIEGDENQVLVPGERYAQMRNVYFIPSAAALTTWLEKCGFVDVRVVDICTTTTQEQRRTDWMITESLAEFLDPEDPTKTVEGYPAPVRAVLVARKPGVYQP